MRIPNPSIDPAAIQPHWSDKPTADSDQIHKSLRCTLVTPMFGGGVEAGKVDLDMPVRGASIRGQLRFWWRIAHGPFSSDVEMFRRETAIWGGIGASGPTASKVSVQVAGKAIDTQSLAHSNSYKDNGIKYAFGPSAIDGGADWLRPGYQFELHLRYPEAIRNEVETALRWWASFGGIGARTRRGFGALKVDGLDAVSSDEVSTCGGRLAFISGNDSDAEKQWYKAVGKLFSFRQGPGIGRGQGSGNRPGRSYWPEADQLRRFTGRHASNHSPEHPAGNVFPRAAFGLPIMFEFKGSREDPPKTELLPSGDSDRMASPLILRPYRQGNNWRATALLLPGWQTALDQTLRLKERANDRPANWPADAAQREQIATQIKPMTTNKGQPRADDPLSAFMHYFEQ